MLMHEIHEIKYQSSQEKSSENISILHLMASHSDDIRIDRITMQMVGDHAAASVLTRIVYWFSPTKEGQKRTRILKNGKCWIAKTDEDWYEECYVTKDQMRRIKSLLISLGVIDIDYFRFNGLRTCHYSLNIEAYTKLYNQKAKEIYTEVSKDTSRKWEKAPSASGKTHRPLTKEYKQRTYTNDLENKDVPDPRILSLLRSNVKEVFEVSYRASDWLHNLGMSSGRIDFLMDNYTFINLMAGAEYLRNQYENNLKKGKEMKNIAGYFYDIMEKGWYLQKKPSKENGIRV